MQGTCERKLSKDWLVRARELFKRLIRPIVRASALLPTSEKVRKDFYRLIVEFDNDHWSMTCDDYRVSVRVLSVQNLWSQLLPKRFQDTKNVVETQFGTEKPHEKHTGKRKLSHCTVWSSPQVVNRVNSPYSRDDSESPFPARGVPKLLGLRT